MPETLDIVDVDVAVIDAIVQENGTGPPAAIPNSPGYPDALPVCAEWSTCASLPKLDLLRLMVSPRSIRNSSAIAFRNNEDIEACRTTTWIEL